MSLRLYYVSRSARFLLIGWLAIAGLAGCTQTQVEPLQLPAWVTVAQHLLLEITDATPEYRFALSCRAEELDGPTSYSAITILVTDAQDQNEIILPQPDVDCATSKGMVVSKGSLSLPPNVQAGDLVHIYLEVHQPGGARGKAGHEYMLGEDGQLYEVHRRRWPW